MDDTSKKHKAFVGEPMDDKPVTALAGIGVVLGGRLIERGFEQADHVLGQLIVFRKDRTQFVEWLHETIGANIKQAGDCYNCLTEWCNQHL